MARCAIPSLPLSALLFVTVSTMGGDTASPQPNSPERLTLRLDNRQDFIGQL
jgi:hypothetical protein